MKPLHHSFFLLMSYCLFSLNVQAQVNPLVDSTAINALNLNGTQDLAFLSNAGLLETGVESEFLVEVWVNPAEGGQTAAIFCKGSAAISSSQIYLGLESGYPKCSRGNVVVTTETALPVGEWTHMAAKFTNNELSLMLNGISVSTSSQPQSFGSSDPTATIGSKSLGGLAINKFSGLLEEFKFWNTGREKGHVNKTKHTVHGNVEPDLSAYIQFNEAVAGESLGGDPGTQGMIDASGTHHLIADELPITVSSCPVVFGTSQLDWSSQSEVYYEGTDVSLSFTDPSEYMVAVAKGITPPNTWSGIELTENILDQSHWFISWFEVAGLSADLKIHAEGSFPIQFHGEPEEFKLMRRGLNSTGAWTQAAVGSSMDEIANTVTFSSITEEGQYAVVMGDMYYPTTQLEVGSCGASDVGIRQKLYAEHIDSDSMQFIVQNDLTGYLDSLTTAGRALKLSKLTSNVDYGTTYNVKARGMWNEQYGSFGNVCQITTSGIPTSRIRPEYCGTAVSPGASIYAVGVTGTDEYIFEVSDAFGYFEEYSTSAAKIRLRELNGPIHFERTYTIRVRCIVGADSSEYGLSCDVTTIEWPLTQLQTTDCGRTDVHTAWWLKADGVQLVDGYEFEVSHPGSGYLDSYISPIKKFKLRDLPGTSNTGLTYDIRVRTIIDSDTSDYGPVCQVTTQTIGARMGQFSEDGAEVELEDVPSEEAAVIENAFPNPFTTSITLAFTLSVDQAIEIQIYDSMGRMVKAYAKTELNAGDHQFIWDGTNDRGNDVSPGTYIMTLRNDLDFMIRSQRVLLRK